MESSVLTLLFAGLLTSMGVKLWLSNCQLGHVAFHREQIPDEFAHIVSSKIHQRTADYTLTKGRFGLVQPAVNALVLLVWTFWGGFNALKVSLRVLVLPGFGSLAY